MVAVEIGLGLGQHTTEIAARVERLDVKSIRAARQHLIHQSDTR
jgi:tRNA G46 methylase TrmB